MQFHFLGTVGFTTWQHLVKSGWEPTCDNAQSWGFYSAAPLGDQTASTMTRYPTHFHYIDT